MSVHVRVYVQLIIVLTALPTFQRAMLTFKEAFGGKAFELASKLKVTNELLLKLMDAKIIDSASFRRIKKSYYNSGKVGDLLHVVEQRDDSLLPDFCRILKDVEQLDVVKLILPNGHYLRYELIPCEVDAKLVITVEPRYGLLGDLYSRSVIYDYQQTISSNDQIPVNERVWYLLQAVKKNWGTLNNEAFLQALKDDNQLHVVNYINADGKIGPEFGDVRPLSEQQRRRLWSTQDVVVKLDLQEGRFLDLLQARGVISAMQQKDVADKSKQSRNESFKLLLEILERRSLADLNQFIELLCVTKQWSIVQWLTEKGAVARLRSTINQPEMLTDRELNVEAVFEKTFNDLNYQKEYNLAIRLRELMEKNGFKITYVRNENSIVWFIMCRSLDRVNVLRWLYDFPSKLLSNTLQCIFSHTCGSTRGLQLCVKWTTKDFEKCRHFVNKTPGQPFDLPKYLSEPPMVPDFIVSI